MKSGGGVLLVSVLQLVVGLILLGIYEGYKAREQLPGKTWELYPSARSSSTLLLGSC